jgi:hypothetical protein
MLSRIAVLVHLGLLCLCLNSWFPGDCHAQGRRPSVKVKEPSPGQAEKTWSAECRGWGQNEDEALNKDEAFEDAAKNSAREQVERHLREGVTPPLLWTPLPEEFRKLFIRKLLKKDSAKRQEGQDKEVAPGIKAKCWTFTVTIGPRELEELKWQAKDYSDELDRQRRAQVALGRLDLMTRVLAGLVVFLLAVVGYIRLDEWTKGYYSRWLAAGLITMTLLGLGIIFVR